MEFSENLNRAAFPFFLGWSATRSSPMFESIYKAERAIFAIASAAYWGLYVARDWSQREVLRYIDWALTTPLLLMMVWLYGKQKNPKSVEGIPLSLVLLAPAVMSLSGWFADVERKKNGETRKYQVALGLSWLAFLISLAIVYRINKTVPLRGIEWFFYVGWTVYGVAFLLPNPKDREAVYNASDLVNKGVFALAFEELLLKKDLEGSEERPVRE